MMARPVRPAETALYAAAVAAGVWLWLVAALETLLAALGWT